MTFYSYGLNEDRASSLSYNQILAATSSEAAALLQHSNPTRIQLAAVSLQAIGVGSHLTMGVGKVFSAVNAQVIGLTKLTFGLKFLSVTVTSAGAAGLVKAYLGARLLAAQSPTVSGLSLTRPSHAIVAIGQNNIATLARTGNRLLNGIQSAAVGMVKAIGHPNVPTVFLSQVLLLVKGPGLVKSVASAAGANIIRAAGRIAPALIQQQVLAVPKTVGRLIAMATASVAQVSRSFPWRISAASAEAPRLGLGITAYGRLLAVTAMQSILVQRGLSASRGASGINSAGLLRASGRALAASTVGISAVLKGAARTLGSVSSEAGGGQRVVGIPRRTASGSVVLLLQSGLHLPAAFLAVQAQVAATQSRLTHTMLLVINGTQASAVSLSSVLSYLRAKAVLQAQSVATSRAAARTMGVASGASLSFVRSAARFLYVATVSIVAQAGRLLALRAFGTASASAPAIARGDSVSRSTPSTQAAAIAQQRGKVLSLAAAAVTSLGRLTNKALTLLTPQTAALPRSETRVLGAASPSLVAMSRPRGTVLRAVQGQIVAVATWYWLFVADWAYQQTTLLPPTDGPAEPPAFGPIDPADRTTFAFNWASRGDPNDPIVSAQVVSVPPGLNFFGPAFVSGALVEAIVVPSVPPRLPATYALRCSATFASGRRSSFSIPVPVRTL